MVLKDTHHNPFLTLIQNINIFNMMLFDFGGTYHFKMHDFFLFCRIYLFLLNGYKYSQNNLKWTVFYTIFIISICNSVLA